MAFIETSEKTPILYSCLNQLDYPSVGRDREMSVSRRYPPVAARWQYPGIPLSMAPLSVWTGSQDPRRLHVLGLGLLGGDSQTIPVKQTQSFMLGVAHSLAYKVSRKQPTILSLKDPTSRPPSVLLRQARATPPQL